MTMFDKRSATGKSIGPQVIAAVVIGLMLGWSPPCWAIADNAGKRKG